MRHRKKLNHLGRTNSHRKAMLANMASSLLLHKRISTTTAKAKALRVYVEPLITKAKNDSTHSRRLVFSYLKNKHAVSELFREIATKIANRPGGYTRILRTGNRLGDNADMCIIELVDYNENMLASATETKTKGKRTRRRGGKKKETGAAEKPAAATTEQETGQLSDTEEKPEQTPVREEDKSGEQKGDPPAADVEAGAEAVEKKAEVTSGAEEKEEKAPGKKTEEAPGKEEKEKKAAEKKAKKKESPAEEKQVEEKTEKPKDPAKGKKTASPESSGEEKKKEKKDSGEEPKEESKE